MKIKQPQKNKQNMVNNATMGRLFNKQFNLVSFNMLLYLINSIYLNDQKLN